jgi:prepilin-type N-terminal cleavage/methylation domain-containing protein
MRRLHKNNKGFSLIEVIVALTILGIATVPIAATFINAMHTAKLGEEQLEVCTIIRIVKENVADAVKNNAATVYANTKNIDVSAMDVVTDDLAVMDHLGNDYTNGHYPSYKFDVIYKGKIDNCHILHIILKMDKGSSLKRIREFNIEVNNLIRGTQLENP